MNAKNYEKSKKKSVAPKKKVPAPAEPPAVAEGWYTTTEDLDNPMADGRSEAYINRSVWAKDTLVFVKVPKDGYRGQVEWPDGTTSNYGKHDAEYPTWSQANSVLFKLEPAKLNLKMLLRKSYGDAEILLAATLDYVLGMSLEKLKELDEHLKSMPEDRFKKFMASHGLPH